MFIRHYDDIKILRRMKYVHLAITVIYPIVALIIVYLTLEPEDGLGGWSLDGFEIYLIIASLIMMAFGLFLPRIAKWNKKTNRNFLDVFAGLFYRLVLLAAGAGFGALLSYTGGGLYISIPLVLISAILYTITIPTDKRLAKWYDGYKIPD
jgi:H+/gluconate symporter-like permease